MKLRFKLYYLNSYISYKVVILFTIIEIYKKSFSRKV